QNLALSVDGAPQVNHAPIDFQIDLVKMPDRMRFGTALSQFRCNDRSEMIHPPPDGLVRDHNPALGEQVFDVAEAEREPEVQPNRLVNDLRREPVARVADFLHPLGYRASKAPASGRCRDNALFGSMCVSRSAIATSKICSLSAVWVSPTKRCDGGS